VAGSCGGAIYTEHSLHLNGVTVDNSVARCGGGLFFNVQYPGQTLVLESSRFLDNMATELLPPPTDHGTNGGGAYVVEKCPNTLDTPHTTPVSVAIGNTEFRGNIAQALSARDARGGGFRSYSRADIVIADSLFVDNHVIAPNPPVPPYLYRGGGIEGTGRSIRIERTEIADNSVTDVTSSNVTRGGGANFFNAAVDLQAPPDRVSVKIVNSTISGNLVSETAGAVQASGNLSLELFNSTVTANFAQPTRTQGILIAQGTTYPDGVNLTARPSLSLVSSILGDNGALDLATAGALTSGFTVNASNSLIDQTCTATCSIFVVGPANLFGVSPQLAPLQANGGPSRTHALLFGSPAINAGSNPLGLATDQRGPGFPRVDPPAPDMGAYETSLN
jgi:hypothetical protein